MIGGVRVGVSICEDAWSPSGPIAAQAAGGAELVVNINASPYFAGQAGRRERMLATRAADASLRARVRQPGRRPGRAGLRRRLAGVRRRRASWWPGPRSSPRTLLVVDLDVDAVLPQAAARPRGRADASRSAEVVVTEQAVRRRRPPSGRPWPRRSSRVAEVYEALVLGTRDYALKNGFTRRRARAVRAGSTRRSSPPSRPTRSGRSTSTACRCRRATRARAPRTDAEALADDLGIDFRTIAIEAAFAAVPRTCWRRRSPAASPDLTEENLQSRIRGMLLMALSNKFGWLVLTTGNKSEMAVGYSTLYGDIGRRLRRHQGRAQDCTVYELCRYVNERGRPGDHPRGGARPSRRRPSCAPTSATTRACRPTRCSTRSWRPTSRTTARRRS